MRRGQPARHDGNSYATATAQAKAYTENELRDLVSGMTDADGNQLKLYSREQMDRAGCWLSPPRAARTWGTRTGRSSKT